MCSERKLNANSVLKFDRPLYESGIGKGQSDLGKKNKIISRKTPQAPSIHPCIHLLSTYYIQGTILAAA